MSADPAVWLRAADEAAEPDYADATNDAQRRAVLLRQTHRQKNARCQICRMYWPCPTIRVLNERRDASDHLRTAAGEVTRLAARVAEIEAGLQGIHSQFGHTCPKFPDCHHAACVDSYGAWTIAAALLAGAGDAEGAGDE